jgi:hypothetical protein
MHSVTSENYLGVRERDSITMDDGVLVSMLLRMAGTAADADDLEAFSLKFREAFLRLGSGTPDNAHAAAHIEYGVAGACPYAPRGFAGLKIRGRNLLLTDVAHAVEDLPLPAQVRAYYPDLTEVEWAAATRMITMLLQSLDRTIGPADRPGHG